MPPLTATTIRSLALIKYMFRQGSEQSHQPSPLFVVALLHFQDAAELFLHLACTHHGITVPPQNQFLQYWKLLAGVAAVLHAPEMDRLNKARVNFKHHGNLPNEQDMEFFRVTTQTFFDDNTPLLFGREFDGVSLVELVSCAPAREFLKQAETDWKLGKHVEARDALALAHSVLMRDYATRQQALHWAHDPFAFGPSMPSGSKFRTNTDRSDPQQRELSKFVEATTAAVEALQGAMKVLAYGLDYRKYARFSTLTPTVSWMVAGNAVVHQGMRNPAPPSKEDFDFCFEFVIECATKLQQFD